MVGYLLQPIIQIENSDGKPLEGGKVYVYKLGITPPVLADTYFDFQGHLNTNPIILDSLGHCTIIAEDDTAYDVIIKNKNDELQFSIHNATVMGGSGEIVIENPEVNVVAGEGIAVSSSRGLDGVITYTVALGASVVSHLNEIDVNIVNLQNEDIDIHNDIDVANTNIQNNSNAITQISTDLSNTINTVISNTNRIEVLENTEKISAVELPLKIENETISLSPYIQKTIENTNVLDIDNRLNLYKRGLGASTTNKFSTYDQGPAIVVGSNNNIGYTPDLPYIYTGGTPSIVVGNDNTVQQNGAGFVIGKNNILLRPNSVLAGSGLIARGYSEWNPVTVIGKYNDVCAQNDNVSNNNYALVIGCGTDDENRKDAFTVQYDGTIHYRYNDEMVQLKPGSDGNFVAFEYNPSGISNNSPAADCKTHFTNMENGKTVIAYCDKGNEYTIIFSKAASGNYGNIIKFGYTDKYIYILRNKNSVWQSEDWEKISAGHADTADTATNADKVDNYHISVGSVGTDTSTIYFV